MATRIRLKRSTTTGKKPLISDLRTAELAYNVYDGILYAKRERPGIGSDIVQIGLGVTVTNIIYVSKDGNDTNSGRKLGDAKGTIRGAVAISTAGTVIRVAPGSYIENNPIELPANVAIIGEGLKEVSLTSQNSSTFFYVNNGTSVSNIQFFGSSPHPIFEFHPTNNVNITNPPYIKNCTNNVSNSIGAKINGNLVSGGLKSMYLESYHQQNQNGIGVSVVNSGNAYIDSLVSVCNDVSVYCASGAFCNVKNSSSSFGNYGLVAEGVSEQLFTGTVSLIIQENTDSATIANLPSIPYDGLVAYFGSLYYTVSRFRILNGGAGYLNAPTVTIQGPNISWGISASAVASISNGSVVSIDVISTGRGYSSPPSITISPPEYGINTATAEAILSPSYYTVSSATPLNFNTSTVSFNEAFPTSIVQSTTVYFFKRSRIIANGQSFEYVGSGTNLSTALPSVGGIPIQENEVVMQDGGLVAFSSVDQSGNFRIGEGVIINQNTGTMEGDVYTRSLFNNVTPLILALGGGD
jgi:hypothetical protein